MGSRPSKLYITIVLTVCERKRDVGRSLFVQRARSSQFREPTCAGKAAAFCVLGTKLS